jgi:hypothetical protein
VPGAEEEVVPSRHDERRNCDLAEPVHDCPALEQVAAGAGPGAGTRERDRQMVVPLPVGEPVPHWREQDVPAGWGG